MQALLATRVTLFVRVAGLEERSNAGSFSLILVGMLLVDGRT